MNKIGYRVKLNDYIKTKSDLYAFLEEYYSLFDICEIKLNSKLTQSKYSKEIIDILFSKYNQRFSFHFNKKLLTEDDSLSKLEEYIINKANKKNSNISCITHLDESLDKDFINKIIYYRSLFNKNASLILENPAVKCDVKEYLLMISEMLHKLKEQSITTGLCLDLGHLFINDKDYEEIIKIIHKENIDKYIREFHLHNVRDGKDHQKVFEGELDYYYLIQELILNTQANMIIETEVTNMHRDGVDNIRKIKTIL